MIKEFILHIFNRGILASMELLSFFPIILVIYISTAQRMGIYHFLLTLGAMYFFGIVLGRISQNINRNIILLLGLAFSLFSGYWLHSQTFLWIVHSILFAILYVRGFKLSETNDPEWFPLQIFFVSYLIHFALIFYFSRVYELHQFLPLLSQSAFLTVIVSLVFMNFKQLIYASLSNTKEYSPPTSMVKTNFVMVILILLFIFAITFIRDIRETLTGLWSFLINTLLMILSFINSLFAAEDALPSAVPQENILTPNVAEAGAEANPFWLLIIEIISTIALVLLGIAIVFLLTGALYRLLKLIYKTLLSFSQNESVDQKGEDFGYEDQKETLFDLNKIKDAYLQKIKDIMDNLFKNETKWDSLTNNLEKIRFLYKYAIIRAVAQGYLFKPYLTPKESAKDLLNSKKTMPLNLAELADVYSSVKYGEKNVADAKVEDLRKKILE